MKCDKKDFFVGVTANLIDIKYIDRPGTYRLPNLAWRIFWSDLDY
jgi:hypothetical protein